MFFSQTICFNQPLATRLFSAAIKEGKLARAYLLAGYNAEEKYHLAQQIAAYFNCANVKLGKKMACLLSEPTSDKIGDREHWCMNCRWIALGEHPQALLRLNGEQSKSGKITVEQARALVDDISKTSSYFRVIVIEDASQEALHRPAANTLLKTIEEPRSDVLLVFFAKVVSEVLATVVSRCQIVNMSNKKQNGMHGLSLLSDSEGGDIFLSDTVVRENKEQIGKALLSLEKFGDKNSSLTDAISLAETMQSLIKDDNDLGEVLDLFVAKELLSLGNFFAVNKEARYAKELFVLCQIAKEQSKHYVGQRAIVETFVFAWHQLKQTGVNPLKVRG